MRNLEDRAWPDHIDQPGRHSRLGPVIIVNSGMQILSRVPIERAARLLTADVAHGIETSPVLATLRSPSTSIEVHRVIAINRTAWRPWQGKTGDSYASNWVILARDGRRCAYCGARAATVDHILPRSRGGASTFANLVAACRDCNSVKADRTPEEADMRLLWAPYVHDPWALDQEYVHSLFSLDPSQD